MEHRQRHRIEAIQIPSTRAPIDVVKTVLASDQRTLGLVQSRLTAGAASEQDVTTAQSQMDRDRTMLPVLHQQLNMAQEAIATLVGSSAADWSAPDFSLAGMSLPQDVLLIVPSELVRSRPDIRATEAQLRAASAAVGIATADLYPRISLSTNMAEQGLIAGPAGAASVGRAAPAAISRTQPGSGAYRAVPSNGQSIRRRRRRTTGWP